MLKKRQHTAHNLLAPHGRLLQFLSSHFNATRLGSPHTEEVFTRLLDVTLDGLKSSTGHPLAREIRFQIILFGLNVLRHTTALNVSSRYRLKDKILSAALSWFTFAPRWSFGSNKLQLKAEVHLLSDVSAELRHVAMIPQKPSPLTNSIQAKDSLLQLLIQSEQVRLTVWLNPLIAPAQDSRRPPDVNSTESPYFYNANSLKATLISHVHTAWQESPSLALQLIARFPSQSLQKEIRQLLLKSPEKAICEPEAIHVLLGGLLPTDVSSQLKVYYNPFLLRV